METLLEMPTEELPSVSVVGARPLSQCCDAGGRCVLLPGPRQPLSQELAAARGVGWREGTPPSQGFLGPPTWRLSRHAEAGALRPQLSAPEVPLGRSPPGSPPAFLSGRLRRGLLEWFPRVPGGTPALVGSDHLVTLVHPTASCHGSELTFGHLSVGRRSFECSQPETPALFPS